jgi:Tol biopolymer transport system component
MKLQQMLRSRLSIGLARAVVLLLMPTVLASAQEKIAFSSSRDGNSEIYVMNADGANQTRLTNNSTEDFEPAFSRDGSKIAFWSGRDGNFEIYVMNADGTNQTRLTNNSAFDSSPAWSGDGSKIAFASTRDGNAEIYIMNADGSNQTRLTNNPASDSDPAFSPDGREIAFQTTRDGGVEIYKMNADGTDQVNLTNNSGNDTVPCWSPDGRKIAFRGLRNGTIEVYVMNADGTDQVSLTNNAALDTEPSFSPDGSKIAFRTDRDGNREIYAMNADGSNPVNLTNNSELDISPSWGAANFEPVLSDVAVSSPVDEGSMATVTGRISDPNEGDSFTITVDWGEGLGVQLFEFPAGTRSFELTHPYTDDNPANTSSDNYTISVTVNDHRFGTATGSTVVTVNNVAPLLSGLTVSPSPAVLGSPITLSFNLADPGWVPFVTDESPRLTIDWGDGHSEIMDPFQPGQIQATHNYAALGSYMITLHATDNDLGETVQTISVEVSPPPPPSAPTAFRVDYIGKDRIQLAWTDASNNEDGFAIERCSNRGCSNFAEIGRAGQNTTVYLDNGLFSNTQYYYRMKAFNLGGMSSYTDVVSAKTLRK